MKQIILSTALFLMVAGVVSAQEWNMDKAHSQVMFVIGHMGINQITGSFGTASAKITSSKEDFSDAVIEFTADVNSINTGNEQRNNHLKSDAFFNAAQFGTLTFKSTSFKKVADNKYELSGDLTMHGVTRPVTLDAVYNGSIVNPMSKKTTAGFKVTGIIKRSDFSVGKDFPTNIASDEVRLDANTEFVKS